MHDHTTMLPVIPVDDDPPSSEPRSADLPLSRVLLALAVAPLLGSVLMTLGIGFVDSMLPQDRGIQWRYLALSLALPSLWSVLCGLAYLRTVTRLRGQIARSECLLLGCACGLLMPFAMDGVDTLIWHAQLPQMTWSELKAYSIGGLFTLPFGLFGGWVFWRLGVRPTPAPLPNFAVVFD
jgi:hypothetical protein